MMVCSLRTKNGPQQLFNIASVSYEAAGCCAQLPSLPSCSWCKHPRMMLSGAVSVHSTSAQSALVGRRKRVLLQALSCHHQLSKKWHCTRPLTKSQEVSKACEGMSRKACRLYMAKKHRYCRFQCREGSEWCGNHEPVSGPSNRVPCPIDPRHTVVESELERHLALCPKGLQQRERQARPYFKLDCNAGGSLSAPSAAGHFSPHISSGQGQAPHGVQVALEQSAPCSDSRSPCLESLAAPVQGSQALSNSQSQAGIASQKLGAPAQTNSNGSSTCLDSAAASAEGAHSPSHISGGGQASASASRAAYLERLGSVGFDRLLGKIEAAHAQAWDGIDDARELIPIECQVLLEDGLRRLPGTDHVRPFVLKHARQQAAILGQLQVQGLLQDTRNTNFLELGAGKAYLACMLAEAFPVNSLVLVDSHSFKLQADRTLRRLGVSLERIKSDIKDFEPAGVTCLGSGQPWVGMGKHLCGAATDFALLCMARSAAHSSATHSNGPGSDVRGEFCSKAEHQGLENQQQNAHGNWSQAGSAVEAQGARLGLQGFGIATCCHHRCSWEHYVGRSLFQEHGMSEQDFQLVTWMTGWATCGHGRPSTAKQPGTPEGPLSSDSDDGCDEEVDCIANSVQDESRAEEHHRTAAVPFIPSMAVPLDRRRSIGAKCKQLIDAGRLKFLRSNGFRSAYATSYVGKGVTGENCMLVGSSVH